MCGSWNEGGFTALSIEINENSQKLRIHFSADAPAALGQAARFKDRPATRSFPRHTLRKRGDFQSDNNLALMTSMKNTTWDMFWKKPQSLISLGRSRAAKGQIKRARILVVDDDEHAFPSELLKAEGYNVTYWDSIRTLEPLETGEYDLIVLDLNNIASSSFSSSDGIGILKHIKTYNPAQIVIAYSAKKYDFKQADFWKLADDFLGKPSPLVVCKQKIDELLQAKFNVEYYWEIVKRKLAEEGASAKQVAKLEKLVITKTDAGESIKISDVSDIIKLGKESLSAVFTIISIIGKILS